MSRMDYSIIAPMFARGAELGAHTRLDEEQARRAEGFLRLQLRQQRMNEMRFASSEQEVAERQRGQMAARDLYKRLLPEYGVEVDDTVSRFVDQAPLDFLEKSIDDLRRNRESLDKREGERQKAQQGIDQQRQMLAFLKSRDPAAFSPAQEAMLSKMIDSGAKVISGPMIDPNKANKPSVDEKKMRRDQLGGIEKELTARLKTYDAEAGDAPPESLLRRLEIVRREIDRFDDDILGPMPGDQVDAFPQGSFLREPDAPYGNVPVSAPQAPLDKKETNRRRAAANEALRMGRENGWTDEQIEQEYNRRIRQGQ